MAWQAAESDAAADPAGERLALVGLAVPWLLVSLILPPQQMWASLALVSLVAVLVLAAAAWSRARAAKLGHDAETWALAAVLTLGYSMAVLVAPARDGSVLQALCHDCGTLSDAHASFCYRCGSVG